MTPHRPGEYRAVRRKRRTKAPAAKRPALAKHPVKAKAKKPPRLRDQTRQFTGVSARAIARAQADGRPAQAPGFRITPEMLARAKGNRREATALAREVFAMAKPMPGVVPKGKATIAMDSQIEAAMGWAAQSIYNGAFAQGVTFLGYPYLAELAQRAEYRRISEVIATEMTRKWIEIKSHRKQELIEAERQAEPAPPGAEPGIEPAPPPVAQDELDPGKLGALVKLADLTAGKLGPEGDERDEKVKALEAELKRLNARDVFKELAEQDGFFGRAHLYIDLAAKNVPARDLPNELRTPIGDGEDRISQAKIKPGSLLGLKTVEAVWCYPANYNSSDPLQPDWYKPTMWFVQGKEVHGSRLLTFVGREVPDMLKPAYSFGGLALSQMVQPCVQNWLRTRQSVSDIIHSFSVFVLKTNLGESVQEDGDQLFKRADFFNLVRDNRGLMLVDKDSEDFANVAAPLSTLDALQAQSQEHICSVSGIPLVKYTGIAPSGLNASGEEEIRVFYDWIAAYQQALFTPNLTRVFHMAQLNLWGKVDPDLYFEYVPLWQLSEKEEAEVRKTEADTDAALINAGVLDPVEVRQRLADDVDGPYAGINVNAVPAPPAGADPFGQGEGFEEEGDEGAAPNEPDGAVAQPEV